MSQSHLRKPSDPKGQKINIFVEEDYGLSSKEMSKNSSTSNFWGMKFNPPPKKTAFVGGGFGMGMDTISAFDDRLNKEQDDDYNNLEHLESFYRNQRLTITNPYHYEEAHKDLKTSFEDLHVDLAKKMPKWFAWGILIYFCINNALIPPWILSTPAEKYLRIAWRFLMQAFLLIPFAMYEYRTLQKGPKKHMYTLKHIFDYENLKTAYLTSFSASLWFTMVLFGFEWTQISHSINLASLQLFIMSFKRPESERHSYELPGKAMVIFGIILIFIDSLTLTQEDANPSAYTFKVTKYLFRETWQRVIFGDCVAFSVSYFMTKFTKANKQTNAAYPPHLRAIIVSTFNVINMTLSSYFFSGTDIFRGKFWGWFGLFTSEQFSGFLYMSIVLGLGSFLSTIFLAKLFEPIDIQTAQSFEPVITTLLVSLVGVQHLPQPVACIGFVFIVPGLFFINLGQHLKTQQDNMKKEQEIQKRISILPLNSQQELQQKFRQSQRIKEQ